MSLFSMSGLKKAYESIGEEITRTFDSSSAGTEGREEEEHTEAQVGVRCSARRNVYMFLLPPQVRASPPQSSGSPQPPAAVELAGQEGEWGQWEEQKKPSMAAPSARYRKTPEDAFCL